MSNGAEAAERSPVTGQDRPDAGAIYDLGYRHYSGPRLGRWYALRSLALQSLRTAFGIGRGTRAKLAPFALLAMSLIPAIIQSGIAGATGNVVNFITHDRYFTNTAWIFALFVAGQAPELVGGDQQYRVLSLYFSRALRRSDYVAAKLAALVAALLIMAVTPHLVLLLGRIFANENPLSVLRSDIDLLLPIFGSALSISLLFASLGLLIASITPRRLVATAGIIGVILLSSGIASALVRGADIRYAALASPMLVGESITNWMFGVTPHARSVLGRADLPGAAYGGFTIAVLVGSALLLNFRYSRART